MSTHVRVKHPNEYSQHQLARSQAVVDSQARKRWTPEEKVLLAEEEARLVAAGTRANQINKELAKVSTRTQESIKKLRQKEDQQALVRAALERLPIQVSAATYEDGPPVEVGAAAETQTCTQQELDVSQSENLLEPGGVTRINPLSQVDEIFKNRFRGLDLDIFSESSPNGLSTNREEVLSWMNKEMFELMGANGPAPARPQRRLEKIPSSFPCTSARKRYIRRFTQRFWERDPSGCGKAILNGTLLTCDRVEQTVKEEYWKEVFSRQTEYSGGEYERMACSANWALIQPISLGEIEDALKASNETAVGVDGVRLAALKRANKHRLCRLFQVFQSGLPPSWIYQGRVTLIPKTTEPSAPNEYRPLTISPHITRVFHKVLANRLTALPISERQVAYRPIDGCGKNTFILQAIVRDAWDNTKPLHLCFLDVAKAFDSVARGAISAACKRLGVPEPFIDYIQYSLANGMVRIGDNAVTQNSGVRQGDPLSGYLFNAVIDLVCSKLSPEIGYLIKGSLAQYLAYADDLIVFAESKAGLQHQIRKLVTAFGQCGMTLNAKKCVSLSIVKDAKRKTVFVDHRPYLEIGQEICPAMREDSEYKYLGIKFGPHGVLQNQIIADFEAKLQRITQSELRPNQRLHVLRQQLLPGFTHVLVLSSANLRVLRELDLLTRRAVRKWLHLPNDTAKPSFHAPVKYGGLGLPCLEVRIRRLRAYRLGKISCELTDDLLSSAVTSQVDSKGWERNTQYPKLAGREITTDLLEAEVWRDSLLATEDGKGLKEFQRGPQFTSWILDPLFPIAGREFVKAIHVRLNVFKTPTRSARGRPEKSKLCPADRQISNSNHISSICQTTYGLRIRRHDNVVRALSSYLKTGPRRGRYKVLKEPRIPWRHSFLKPDLVIRDETTAKTLVVDPIVSNDRVRLEEVYDQKAGKYNDEHFKLKVCERLSVNISPGLDAFESHGLAINLRGAVSQRSRRLLLRLFPRKLCNILMVRVLTDTWKILDFYNRVVS